MRGSGIGVFFAVALLIAFGAPAQAQRACKEGTKTTATGTIGNILRMGPNLADIFPNGKPRSQCAIDSLTLDGRPLPANCVNGRKFTAAGEMGPDPLDLSDDVLTLYIETIRCE